MSCVCVIAASFVCKSCCTCGFCAGFKARACVSILCAFCVLTEGEVGGSILSLWHICIVFLYFLRV